jgi:hypothetical protein
MGERKPQKKVDQEVMTLAPYVLHAYLAGLEHGFLMSLVRYVQELKRRGLVPKEKAAEVIEVVLRDYGFGTLSYGDLFKKIGQFYKHIPNRGIPVVNCVSIVCLRENGVITDEEMEKELQKLRLEFHKEDTMEIGN